MRAEFYGLRGNSISTRAARSESSAPAALEASISLQQQLVVERHGRIDTIDAALEVDAARLDLVGLTLGQRVFALHYDGRDLQSWRHPSMPPELRGEDVLEDLQLTLWPASAIKQALPAGWRIEDDGSSPHALVRRHARHDD